MKKEGEGNMNEQAKKKLENDLKRYWKNIQKIEALKRAFEKIENDIRDLRGVLAEKEDLIPSPAQLKFIPGGGRGGSSEFTPIEQSLHLYEMNQARIYKKIQELRRRHFNIKCRISQVEYRMDWISYIARNYLDSYEQKVFEQCYCYCRSNSAVALALHCDEKTIRRKRDKILLTFYDFLRLRA